MRLSSATLPSASQVRLPTYDSQTVTPGIVHLGVGNFHRAHQAVYIDDCLAADPSWGIIGVSLRRPDMADALRPQDGLYTVTQTDASGHDTRVIGSLLQVLHQPTQSESVMAALTAPATRIVSLTITEKGYARDPSKGDLDQTQADIAHDLAHPNAPARSAVGLLVTALAARRSAGLAPFTVLPCDNLPANGQSTARVLSQFAAARDDRLSSWIDANLSVPSTMVDRIVPATTDADRAMLLKTTGIDDAWPVMTEPFRQWVIEDQFPYGRPDLASAGVEMVQDVHAHETMKLRMLNGAHSTLAYMGQLMGHTTVAEAMGDPLLRAFVTKMWSDEITPTLALPPEQTAAYAAALTQRFDNPALHHQLAQIANDGSEKIPQRLLGTLLDRDREGAPSACLIFALAAWIVWLHRSLPNDLVQDPMASQFVGVAQGQGIEGFAEAMLSRAAPFAALQNRPQLRTHLARAARRLASDGPRQTLSELRQETSP